MKSPYLNHFISPLLLIRIPGSSVFAAPQDLVSASKSLIYYNVNPGSAAPFSLLSDKDPFSNPGAWMRAFTMTESLGGHSLLPVT